MIEELIYFALFAIACLSIGIGIGIGSVWGIVRTITKVIFPKLTTGWHRARLPRSVAKPLLEARRYARLIDQTVKECPPGPVQEHLNNLTINHVHESLYSLTQFEQALTKLYQNHRDLKREANRTQLEIQQLRRELLNASEWESTTLRKLLQSKKDYLAVMEELTSFQTQAEMEIRKIASDLATTQAEMLLVITKGDFNKTRLHRMDENLREHLTSLRDMVSVMDELGYSQMGAN